MLDTAFSSPRHPSTVAKEKTQHQETPESSKFRRFQPDRVSQRANAEEAWRRALKPKDDTRPKDDMKCIVTGSRTSHPTRTSRNSFASEYMFVQLEPILREIAPLLVVRARPESWLAEEPLEPPRDATAGKQPSTGPLDDDSTMVRLDQAYEHLDQLLARQHTEGPGPDLERELEHAWARLEELQELAGMEVRRELDASVELPPDKLEALLKQVERDLSDDEP